MEQVFQSGPRLHGQVARDAGVEAGVVVGGEDSASVLQDILMDLLTTARTPGAAPRWAD